jgi:hypothetical protein
LGARRRLSSSPRPPWRSTPLPFRHGSDFFSSPLFSWACAEAPWLPSSYPWRDSPVPLRLLWPRAPPPCCLLQRAETSRSPSSPTPWARAPPSSHGWRPDFSSSHGVDSIFPSAAEAPPWPAPRQASPMAPSSNSTSPAAAISPSIVSAPETNPWLPSALVLDPPCAASTDLRSSAGSQQGAPLLVVLRGARRLFVKMRSKPRAAGSLFREAQWTARRRRSPWFGVFAQPLCRRRSPPVRPRRFMFDSASSYFPMINGVCAVWFLFCGGEEPCVLREEGQSFNARRMFGAMHKSESPSFLQTPFGFVYGEPMHVALDRLD